MYISDKFVIFERRDLQSNNIEVLWSEIQLTNKKCHIGVMYWPSNSLVVIVIFFYKYWKKFLKCNLPFFILWEFTVNVLLDHHQTLQFMLRLQKFGLSILIYEPTNFTLPQGSCIDLIITHKSGIVYDSFVNFLCCSTHSITGVEVKLHIINKIVIRESNKGLQ